jgi:hypothetical protein
MLIRQFRIEVHPCLCYYERSVQPMSKCPQTLPIFKLLFCTFSVFEKAYVFIRSFFALTHASVADA